MAGQTARHAGQTFSKGRGMQQGQAGIQQRQ